MSLSVPSGKRLKFSKKHRLLKKIGINRLVRGIQSKNRYSKVKGDASVKQICARRMKMRVCDGGLGGSTISIKAPQAVPSGAYPPVRYHSPH